MKKAQFELYYGIFFLLILPESKRQGRALPKMMWDWLHLKDVYIYSFKEHLSLSFSLYTFVSFLHLGLNIYQVRRKSVVALMHGDYTVYLTVKSHLVVSFL